ncbi:ADP-glyceromanno-heptose 6-epimerase [soil metagenome]
MIVITGAAGFIGSCLVSRLNQLGFTNLILVDDFTDHSKDHNLVHKQSELKIERSVFPEWLHHNKGIVTFVYHIGARTDTTEFDKSIFDELNVEYSKILWNYCTEFQIPFVYASSAATYGGGEFGYKDEHLEIPKLQPLNPYGWSKQEFDIWVLQQKSSPPFWAGLKFFNIYGPNEYHKGRMASVIFHAFKQIKESGKVKLFRSHRPDYKDGWQLRDFVYVVDVLNVCQFLLEEKPASAIYNLGTGEARSFFDLAAATFKAMHVKPDISYIDIPADIRDKYQYFTEASMDKLKSQGYKQAFYSLEDGVGDYVKNYLSSGKYY